MRLILKGKWMYLYQAIDKYGATKAIRQHGKSNRINIDKSDANKAALNAINQSYSKDKQIEICQTKYLNNMIEQDHRFIKKRTQANSRLQVILWS